MKKLLAVILSLSLFFGLVWQFSSIVNADNANDNDENLVEDTEDPVPASWNIIDLKFPKRIMTNKKTGNKVLPITATFEYLAPEGEDISFDQDYIWSLHCGISKKNKDGTYSSLFEEKKLFPTNAVNGVGFDSGNKVTSTINFEFDPDLVKLLRRGTPMSCSFGFGKGAEYEYLLMDMADGLYMSYNLTLLGNIWKVKGWDF